MQTTGVPPPPSSFLLPPSSSLTNLRALYVGLLNDSKIVQEPHRRLFSRATSESSLPRPGGAVPESWRATRIHIPEVQEHASDGLGAGFALHESVGTMRKTNCPLSSTYIAAETNRGVRKIKNGKEENSLNAREPARTIARTSIQAQWA
ncbi:hypothetical protein B0H13DRAFT_1876404 [Mycena leptocephala]|nr:hypothetical protein B0H13DRAFT_1876404 [Mycena leptocephala]